MINNPSQYTKFFTAIVGQALTFAALFYGSNHWVVLAIAVASALGVYVAPNTPPPPDPAAIPAVPAKPVSPTGLVGPINPADAEPAESLPAAVK
jgi:hypothetical protein